MRIALLMVLVAAGCGQALDDVAFDLGPALDLQNPLPVCPNGAAQGMPCPRGAPQCYIPGASTEASPISCFCGCSANCHWETDLIAAICDGGVNDGSPSDGGFTCATPCTPDKQYCEISNNGDAGFSAGSCVDLPQGCDACPCLQLQHQCITSCVVQDGVLYLICPQL